MLLQGKTVIITGSNRGIGYAMVEAFASEGANIWAHARKETSEFIESMKNVEQRYGIKVVPVYFDVCDDELAKNTLKKIYKDAGKIDILVNNAGVMQDALIGMISRQMMRDLFDTNVLSVINLTQIVVRFMKRQKQGCIINLASIIGTNGNAGQSVYSATKGAIISFTKSAAKELAPQGIRVNAISPGIVNTQLIKNVPANLMKEKLQNIRLGRICEPREIAETAVFLASDMASYVTGQIIGVDGCTIL